MFSAVRSATSARAGLMSRKAVMSSVTAIRTKVSLPDLPYDYNALEPAICSEIMTLHHSKHHNTYVTNYNLQEEQLDEAIHKGDTNKIIALQGALKFNGGGHINHDIFWTNLAPTNQGGGDFPSGKLYDDLIAKWGSVEAFQKDMAAKTAAVQGSGWGWLGYDKVNKSLKIQTCANQDPLEATTGLIPLLGIDVWEHAYYLQYKNVRPDYLNEIWKIVNWQNVAERYNKAQ